jgi:Xaa-Pro aminopeptidase
MKACKNDKELQGMKEAHLRDGAAVVEFFYWLEQELINRQNLKLSSGDNYDGVDSEYAEVSSSISMLSTTNHKVVGISEVEIDEKLTSFRKRFGKFVDLSFPTIAGVGSNGAIIHYRFVQFILLTNILLKYCIQYVIHLHRRAVPETCKILTDNDLILLDSGAQYIDGTTGNLLIYFFYIFYSSTNI